MKMLVFKFMILISFLAGSYCLTFECYTLYVAECGIYSIAEVQRTETTEDLKNLCSTLIAQGHCFGKVMEKCVHENNTTLIAKGRCFGKVLENCVHEKNTSDNEDDLEIYRQKMRFVESSCEEESQVFQAIANNLNCVMLTWDTMDDICLFEGLSEMQKEKLSNLFDGHIGCLKENWSHSCMNAKFDVECGIDVRDAVAEILSTFDVSEYCKEFRSEIVYLESAFKSEFRRGNYGQAALPGIFKAIIKEAD